MVTLTDARGVAIAPGGTVCRKVSYPSQDIAKRMGVLLRIRFNSPRMVPYRCSDHWHLKTRKNRNLTGAAKRRKAKKNAAH